MIFAALFCVLGSAANDDSDGSEFRRFLMKRQLDTVLSSAVGQDILEAYLDREARRTNGDYAFETFVYKSHSHGGHHRRHHHKHQQRDIYAENARILLWMAAMQMFFD